MVRDERPGKDRGRGKEGRKKKEHKGREGNGVRKDGGKAEVMEELNDSCMMNPGGARMNNVQLTR